MRAVHWFRRDLRLSDNIALDMALKEADEVICLFILDSRLLETSPSRTAFLYSCLRSLDESLQKQGGRLILRQGDPKRELEKLLREGKASTLYFNRDYSPFALRRDAEIEKGLTEQGFTVKTAKDLVIFEEQEILTGSNEPYNVFTPYKKRWLERISIAIPTRFESDYKSLRLQSDEAKALHSLPLPEIEAKADLGDTWYLPGGESEAHRRLKIWAGAKVARPEGSGRIEEYRDNRNTPSLEGTSRLSPFLRFGAVSVRQCYRAAMNAREVVERVAQRDGIDTWIGELIWRDFYYQIMFNFPRVMTGPFQKKYKSLKWNYNPEYLAAWQQGRTGYPIIDAGMRQLNHESWMHNRLRMITASFLTKHLLLNWQEGEGYFWEKLVDGDPAANNGGWQWSASTGTDAQPYFRVFSPAAQSQKFDPEGIYIKRFVPELAKVPAKYIHEPWTMPLSLQEHLGVVIGKNYPAPVVDHKTAREKAIATFKDL